MRLADSFAHSPASRLKGRLTGLLALTLILFGANTLPVSADGPQLPPSGTLQLQSVTVDRRERTYGVFVPASYEPTKPASVVMAFHGLVSTGASMMKLGLNDLAQRDGFIVVYPNGTGRDTQLTWNVGGGSYATRNNVDDVAFVSRVLDDLTTTYNVDRRRIYATGFSDGGKLTFRLACELSDRIAAIAPVAATMTWTDCRPARPVSIITFHGTVDPNVPLAEPKALENNVTLQPIFAVLELWRGLDGCQAPHESLVNLSHQATVIHRTYRSCRAGTELSFLAIEGAAHAWPGVSDLYGEGIADPVSLRVPATEYIWDFFKRHPRNDE